MTASFTNKLHSDKNFLFQVKDRGSSSIKGVVQSLFFFGDFLRFKNNTHKHSPHFCYEKENLRRKMEQNNNEFSPLGSLQIVSDVEQLLTFEYLLPTHFSSINCSFVTGKTDIKGDFEYIRMTGRNLTNEDIEKETLPIAKELEFSYNSFGEELPLVLETAHQLEVLLLQNNSLTSFQSKNQFCLLNALNLRSNQLTEIPPQLFKLNNLHTLILSDNKITNVPISIKNLKSLTSLDLSCNPITQFPEAIQLLPLRQLQFWGTKISRIPSIVFRKESILRNTLISLDLHFNKIESLPLAFCSLSLLIYLDLSSNCLTNIPYDIHRLRNLRHFNLRNNNLRILAPSITKLDLRELYLSNNQFQTPSSDDLLQFNSFREYYEGLLPGKLNNYYHYFFIF